MKKRCDNGLQDNSVKKPKRILGMAMFQFKANLNYFLIAVHFILECIKLYNEQQIYLTVLWFLAERMNKRAFELYATRFLHSMGMNALHGLHNELYERLIDAK